VDQGISRNKSSTKKISHMGPNINCQITKDTIQEQSAHPKLKGAILKGVKKKRQIFSILGSWYNSLIKTDQSLNLLQCQAKWIA